MSHRATGPTEKGGGLQVYSVSPSLTGDGVGSARVTGRLVRVTSKGPDTNFNGPGDHSFLLFSFFYIGFHLGVPNLFLYFGGRSGLN